MCPLSQLGRGRLRPIVPHASVVDPAIHRISWSDTFDSDRESRLIFFGEILQAVYITQPEIVGLMEFNDTHNSHPAELSADGFGSEAKTITDVTPGHWRKHGLGVAPALLARLGWMQEKCGAPLDGGLAAEREHFIVS